MGRKIWIDFETRSGKNLPDVGAVPYINDPQFGIVMMGWAIDDAPARLWLPEMRIGLPFIIKPEDDLYAFNAGTFDARVWNWGRSRHHFPEVGLSQWVDVMALCGRHTYPQGLDFVGKVLKVKTQKDARGKALIKKICKPPFKYTPEELTAFKVYCLDDIETMRDVVKKLPADHLTPEEQAIWIMTQEVNNEGLPVDVGMVRRVTQVLDFAFKKMEKRLALITGQEVTTINQRQRIIGWCADHGVHVENMQKEYLEDLMGSARAETFPPEVREVLKMRLDFSSAAVKKFYKILEMAHNGRIYDNLIYYKANTGRWAGSGFQAHNMVRDSIDDPEPIIQSFRDTTVLERDVVAEAKTLVRPSITAPEGRVLGVADYHSIENVLLAWASGSEDLIELHRRGLDEYKDFATQVFNIDYADVTKEQRGFCKPPVLGAGYGLGGKGLQGYGETLGVSFTRDEADSLIGIYRSSRPKIVNFWYGLRDAAILAVQNPGRVFTYRMCQFKVIKDRTGVVWLTLRLPSNRTLLYNKPLLVEGKFGLEVTHMGIDSYTRQWKRKKVTPGRFTENVIQAIARDIMAKGMMELRKEGYRVLLSIHDEAICELDEQQADIQEMCEVMCRLPEWAEGLPLRAEGELLRRYRKI